MWDSSAHNWVSIPAKGTSGGLLFLWDMEKVLVHEVAQGEAFPLLVGVTRGA